MKWAGCSEIVSELKPFSLPKEEDPSAPSRDVPTQYTRNEAHQIFSLFKMFYYHFS